MSVSLGVSGGDAESTWTDSGCVIVVSLDTGKISGEDTVLTSTNLTFGLLGGAKSVLGEMPPLSKINSPLHPSD